MGEVSATCEFVCDLAQGRKLSRENLLWLAHLLAIQDQVPDEGTDAELEERIKGTKAYLGWALIHGCFSAERLQRIREVSTPDGSPICTMCEERKAGLAKIEPQDPYRRLGVYLCHVCERTEIKPKRFEGGCWEALPWRLAQAEEASDTALEAIMHRKYARS